MSNKSAGVPVLLKRLLPTLSLPLESEQSPSKGFSGASAVCLQGGER